MAYPPTVGDHIAPLHTLHSDRLRNCPYHNRASTAYDYQSEMIAGIPLH
ncbi:hypothetical protein H6G97_32800 [Nostoc flagelliforme FACHB-838]|uniref:Uncharacterized protein n=1 Tax=Nostoc flagelliforme FACHB-838 TaxID=2692904 RepID=A0ABR8DXA1_9NOSO|nr:hypothetical protein [Nostoc flagelliforme]MBD2534061.1 hypothetical protein [Nostoc flagelliforme FACHB-838]